jgi:hypothetical protein
VHWWVLPMEVASALVKGLVTAHPSVGTWALLSATKKESTMAPKSAAVLGLGWALEWALGSACRLGWGSESGTVRWLGAGTGCQRGVGWEGETA